VAVNPLLYEINTRCLLADLSRQLSRPATLHDISDTEITRWQSLGFSHVWLMGVWPNGERVRQHGLQQPALLKRYHELLPDWSPADVGGSTYGISAYEPDEKIGGRQALIAFRERLQAQGLRLILDFIPNHFGLDHPWVTERPDLLIHSRRKLPGCLPTQHNGKRLWIAHGKDPYFDPWSDTAQIDYRNPAARHEMIKELVKVSSLCDGVRCDMAMLVLNDIFAETWKQMPSSEPPSEKEFWTDAIQRVRQQHPDFIFLAEAYWGREPQLQHLGFDYTYDKPFLDHLAHQEPARLQHHFHRAHADLLKEISFLDNHDEPRIASRLDKPAQRAAALLWLAQPGMKLIYEGQMEGWRAQLPVQLWRRPSEPTDIDLQDYYQQILQLRQTTAVFGGRCRIHKSLPAWSGNPSHQNLFVITWQSLPGKFEVIVVNYAPHRGQCRVRLEPETVGAAKWTLQDRLGNEIHQRTREDLLGDGLYLDLAAWGAQWFQVSSEQLNHPC